MKIQCRHISSNANPKPNSLIFVDSTKIAYAFSNQIAIYDIDIKQVRYTIHDNQIHHNRANCIALLSQQNKKILLCGYDSGWLVGLLIQGEKWRKAIAIKDGAGLISISHLVIQGIHYVFTNNNSSTIKYYKLQDQKLVLQQQICFTLNKIVQSIGLFVQDEILMVFIGGVDQKIHYYELQYRQQNAKLQYKFSLSGHENAITKLTLTKDKNNDILLASASKDGYIRIWKITSNPESIKFHKNVYDILKDRKIFLQAVLISHECSVTSLYWVRFDGILQLASSSLDCTVCLWGNSTGEAWSVDSRMGQFLGNKNAYFDVLADPSYKYLGALNYTGALLMWQWKDQKFTLVECFNGHSNAVKGLQWNHSGDYLVSASKDQTTRVIAQSNKNNRYHQISRAQIHGYDINTVTVLKVKDNVLDVIACGADQKVIRILQPPACFANYLNTFTHANLHLYFNSQEEENKYKVSKPQDKILLYEAYSEGGTQVLGLMTKAQRIQKQKITTYYQQEQGGQQIEQEQKVDIKQTKLDYEKAPHEDYLIKHTLWPEMNKLYGHPHQIQTLCRSRVSKRMASSCAALNKQAASIIIWNTEEWKISKILPFHNYTVYGIQFSYNDKYFASVSKDRKLAIYSGSDFEVLFNYEAHLRTITCLSFHRSQQFILTGSRDKTVRLHSINEQKQLKQILLKHPVSALSCCVQSGFENYFAVGCVNGSVFLGKIENGQMQILLQIEDSFKHTQCVTRIKWNGTTFATSSDDFSVRIYDIVPS